MNPPAQPGPEYDGFRVVLRSSLHKPVTKATVERLYAALPKTA